MITENFKREILNALLKRKDENLKIGDVALDLFNIEGFEYEDDKLKRIIYGYTKGFDNGKIKDYIDAIKELERDHYLKLNSGNDCGSSILLIGDHIMAQAMEPLSETSSFIGFLPIEYWNLLSSKYVINEALIIK